MAAREDQERFRGLYLRHHPSLIAFFTRRIGSQEAMDCTDEVFSVAWRRFDQVPSDGSALPWLYGVARNVLANRRRSGRRHNRLLARLWGTRQTHVLGPEPEVLRSLEGRRVVEALALLRADDRDLLLLSYWEGLTHRQIGELLGCSTSAVDARAHRALGRMRRAMDRSGGRPGAPVGGTTILEEQ